MIKKILVLLLCTLLFGCSSKKIENTIEYIEPVNDIFIFGQLDNALKYRIEKANNNKQFENYQFKMLFNDVFKEDLVDIYGNTINLTDYDRLIIEVVSVKCEHCKRQLQHVKDFASSDATFVQYFNVGEIQEIIDVYKEQNVDIPDNIICIPKDKKLHRYLKDDLSIELYPTILTFNNNKNAFSVVGEIEPALIENIYDISFVSPLKEDDFIYDGINIIDSARNLDDVRNDISQDNLELLMKFDNDGHSEDLTLRYIGREVDFTDLNNGSSMYYSEIDDYSIFESGRHVLLYSMLDGNNYSEKIAFINELIDNKDNNYVVVLHEGAFGSSTILKQIKDRYNCPVVSNLGKIPHFFQNIPINSYPTAVFIENGIITGVYSNIESKDAMEQAINMFLGDTSIARKENN